MENGYLNVFLIVNLPVIAAAGKCKVRRFLCLLLPLRSLLLEVIHHFLPVFVAKGEYELKMCAGRTVYFCFVGKYTSYLKVKKHLPNVQECDIVVFAATLVEAVREESALVVVRPFPTFRAEVVQAWKAVWHFFSKKNALSILWKFLI